jgi:dCMP deaminase
VEDRELEKLRQFMVFSRAASTLSKDRSTKLGAAILGPGFEIRALGYNGFPRGVNDDISERHTRPLKYKYTEHAERNAIYNAAKVGTPLDGCRLLLDSPIFVCSDCARAIINVGIRQVVLIRRSDSDEERQQRWEVDECISRTMFEEAGVDIVYITEEAE